MKCSETLGKIVGFDVFSNYRKWFHLNLLKDYTGFIVKTFLVKTYLVKKYLLSAKKMSS